MTTKGMVSKSDSMLKSYAQLCKQKDATIAQKDADLSKQRELWKDLRNVLECTQRELSDKNAEIATLTRRDKMKFNLPEPQPMIVKSLQVGNVYPCRGGKKTKYWVVIGIADDMCHLIGLNQLGEISSTASYGVHVFDGSSFVFKRCDSILGYCPSIATMNFDIEWFE